MSSQVADGRRKEIKTPEDLASWFSNHFTRSKLACGECEEVANEVWKQTYNAGLEAAAELLRFHQNYDLADRVNRMKKK